MCLLVRQLFQAFPDEASSRNWLENLRWPDGQRCCPHCRALKTSTVKNEMPMPYHCGECREYFSVKTGTVMQSSKVPLQKWVIAMHLLSADFKRASSMKLHLDLGLTRKTAWLLTQKIRQGFIEGSDKLTEHIDVDEAHVGGKERKKRRIERLTADRKAPGNVMIIRAKKCDGRARAGRIKKTNYATLQSFVTKSLEQGSATGEYRGYTGLSAPFLSQLVKHLVGEYMNHKAYTHGTESCRTLLKRGYKGTYNKMSLKHVARRLTEFMDRYKIRDLDTLAKLAAFALGLDRIRLRYSIPVTNHG